MFPVENDVREIKREVKEREEDNKIYNSIPVNVNKEEVKKEDVSDEDDEWGAVPAFLRRNRGK
jgi:hypothetical protein